MIKHTGKMRVKGKILPYLLFSISDGQDSMMLSRKFNMNKQLLYYYLAKLRRLGLIQQIQKYPYGVYKITSKGERVKENLRQSEKQSLFRCHDLIVGFPILSFGSFNFLDNSRRKIICMKNWRYAREEKEGFVINIQETGLFKIYCPQKYSSNPDDAFGKMYAEATAIAQEYCDKYNMKLSNLKVIRKGHKSLVNSENFAKLLGKINLGEVWVDESNGTGELEARQDNYTIEELLKIPKLMINQTAIMTEFSRQIELHLDVLNRISSAMDKFNKKLDKL